MIFHGMKGLCSGAAVNGHFDTVQWAIQNGCPCDEVTRMRVEEFAAGVRSKMHEHDECFYIS
jgi:hypothetical protein